MKRGQILVELLLALGVAMVVLTALAGVTTRSVFNSGFARRQSQASELALGGIEWVRSERNRLGWSYFSNYINGTYCMDTLDPTVWSTSGNSCTGVPVAGTTFIRRVDVSNPTGVGRTVKVTVDWTEGSHTYTARQTTILKGF